MVNALTNNKELVCVAYQGVPGAHSENAIHQYFPASKTLPCHEFKEVFSQVIDNSVNYGLLPIENSLTGSIHQNYDLLLKYPRLKIVGEITTRIVWCLIGIPGTKISTIEFVLSHPQGLAQCEAFLTQFPNWTKVPFFDTAGAVAEIAREQNPKKAALAGASAAKKYKMQILSEGMETNTENFTRFVIIAKEDHPAILEPTKASIVFSTQDHPGSLYEVLRILAKLKLNMKKLESRPILGQPWEYMFYVDIEVPENKNDFYLGMEKIRYTVNNYRLLGTYKAKFSAEI